MFIVGGADASGPLGGTWTWDGVNWAEWTSTSPQPSARWGHVMAFDSVRSAVVLFGGNWTPPRGEVSDSEAYWADTWELAVAGGAGTGCTDASECTSGFCVDGVCCDSDCGGAVASDCRACNVAGSIGTCTMRTVGDVCRNDATSCDQPETCDGVSPTCPPDVFARAGTVCDDGDACNGLALSDGAGACVDGPPPVGSVCDGGAVALDAAPTVGDGGRLSDSGHSAARTDGDGCGCRASGMKQRRCATMLAAALVLATRCRRRRRAIRPPRIDRA